MSVNARDRKLEDWYHEVSAGTIKLPRFQRHEAWDRNRIASLMQTVISNLPLGITLVLNVGDEEQFISRYLATAPETNAQVREHLLDGQQRLTAMWRVLNNNYERETFYVYLSEFDDNASYEAREDKTIFCRNRWNAKHGDRRPLWCDLPPGCLKRGLFPANLLRPGDIQPEIDAWIKEAISSLMPDSATPEQLTLYYETKQKISDRIKDFRSVVANYNLPYLALPATTDKAVALDVFINMNTNSKPLSQYDIIVAEVESVMGSSLHDLEESLGQEHPEILDFADLSDLILTTSALLQGHLPNQKGAWAMDKRKMVDNWPRLTRCIALMAAFLKAEGIYDSARLPTNAVLAPIAALYDVIPDSGDKRGRDELLLKRYLWHSFFSDRYENAAATHAFSDFQMLRRVIKGEIRDNGLPYTVDDIPVFEHALATADEVAQAEWPKRATIRGRAVLAVMCRLGAFDFATGQQLNANNIKSRHYHHVYPDALLQEAGIESFLAVNCALISDKTNLSIGRKDPVVYLMARYQWASEAVVSDRLQSHLIPVPELANGGYENLSDEEKNLKLTGDFRAFATRRAAFVVAALSKLIEGRPLSANELFSEVEAASVEA